MESHNESNKIHFYQNNMETPTVQNNMEVIFYIIFYVEKVLECMYCELNGK